MSGAGRGFRPSAGGDGAIAGGAGGGRSGQESSTSTTELSDAVVGDGPALPVRAITRRRLQALVDGSVMGLAVVVAAYLRYEFGIPHHLVGRTLLFAVLAGGVLILLGHLRGLYSGHWGFGSFEETSTLVGAVAASTAVLYAVDLIASRFVPLSVPLIASGFALTGSAGVRYLWRLNHERRLRPSGDDVARVVVIGAGVAGLAAIGTVVFVVDAVVVVRHAPAADSNVCYFEI